MALDIDWFTQWLNLSARVLHEQRDELTDLDRAIGDGDHGENLDRGFSAVISAIEKQPPSTIAAGLKTVALTLMSTVGGASGPLLGTAYLRMSTVAASELDAPAVCDLIEAACKGIQQRGKAEPGDKTMVDAWSAAATAAREKVTAGGDAISVLEVAAAAAHKGAQSTVNMVARKGRASYLGERSVGHLDPGAVSSAYILHAAYEAAL